MKVLMIAHKSLLEILREAQLLGLELALPVVFLLITKAMYNAPLLPTYPVWIIDSEQRSTQLVQELGAQYYPDGRPAFEITMTGNEQAAETALKDKTAAVLLIFPSDGSEVILRGDAISSAFYHASVILETLLRKGADRAAGRVEVMRVDPQPIQIAGRPAAGPQNLFDFYAPGIIVFAILLLIPQTAMLVAREVRLHTLRRLRLTRANAWDLLVGISLAQMAVAVVQIVLVFLSAQALGFHNQGSLWSAILVGLVISFSSIGLGLIVACFVENDSQAANVGGTFSMLQVFLSGSWFALPPLTMFTLAGHQIDLFDFIPATSGFLALQQVLVYGAGFKEIAFRLGVTLLLSGVYFLIGVFVFQRIQMRRM